MPFFHAKDGTHLHYNDWGAGQPVVLIHGWPLDGQMWEYQAVHLADHGHRVITYDRRGFGRSAQPWTGYDGIIEGLKKDRPGFLATFGKQLYGVGLLTFSISSDFLQWSQSLAMLGSPKATLDCVRAFSETDFRADLKALTVPTLIIHGEADATVPAKVSAEKAMKLVPHAELKLYPGAPHGLFYTERNRLNADLLAFLA